MESKLERWKDFAYRMAKTHYRQRKSPTFTWIMETLDQCFEHIKSEGADCFVSWDNTLPYPENHSCYGFRKGVPNKPQCLGDWFMEVVEGEVCDRPHDFATTRESNRLDKWNDKGAFDKYGEIKEAIVDRVCEPIHCCVRAGLDLVGEQNGGVLGFAVGDLKQMYAPDPIPDWIANKFAVNLNELENDQGVWL